MRYRELAPGIEVSEIGFGNWTVTTGWWGEYTEQEAIDLHRLAFDRGINFFDTADGYGEDGYAETVLAKALAGKRDQVVIATKFGYDLESTDSRRGQQERPHRTDVPYVRQCLENSLRRLNTDVIDIYQLHNPRMNHVEQDDLWEFLEQAKQEGKVRSYGTALGPRIGWLDEGLAAMDSGRGDAMQMIYNLLEQEPGRDLIARRARPAPSSSSGCRTPAGCWRATSLRTTCSRRTTTAATARAAGWSRACRRCAPWTSSPST